MKRIILIVLVIVALVGLSAALLPAKNSSVREAPVQSYTALGDSVAAGVGLTPDSDSSACDRTDQSYPHQLAATLHYKLSSHACSGATFAAGIIGSQEVNKLALPTQIKQLYNDPKPALITLTVGANDIEWTKFLANCYASVCGSDADTATVSAKLTLIGDNLRATLDQIHSHYAPATPPLVLVTGYHQVFPSGTANCSDLTNIDPSELAWGRKLQSNLNESLSAAVAGSSFAHFVAIDFGGHELCTATPWVQGLNDKQPYHPTELGQRAFAEQLAATIKSLKK